MSVGHRVSHDDGVGTSRKEIVQMDDKKEESKKIDCLVIVWYCGSIVLMVTKGYSMQASYSDKLQTNMLAPFLVILLPFLVFLILFSCDITVNVFFALLGNIAMRARSNP